MSRLTCLAVCALALVYAARAQDGSFVVSNASDFAVTSFNTGQGGAWSRNWIPGDAILPGEQFAMQFFVDDGMCIVPTMVTFEDGSAFDVDVDFCSTGHLVLYNDTIEAE